MGSTALAARSDPEDLRDIFHAYRECCTRAIVQFGGYVAQFVGDGIMAYFGYPYAREDDTERAVRAGIEITSILDHCELLPGLKLKARIGIATGLVVVGDLVGARSMENQAAIGDTPNLSARLQSIAEPNTVVIGSVTRRLVNGLFECVDLGDHMLKGLPEPVRVWRVLGDSGVESRFEAFHVAGLSPFVGRIEELKLLLGKWDQARRGQGQTVLLCGEAGIGKSRIIRTLAERLDASPPMRLSHYGSPFHTHTAFYPVVARLERTANLTRADTPDKKLAKLRSLLAEGMSEVEEVLPLFARLLSIPLDKGWPVLEHDSQWQKERTLAAMLDQLSGLTTRQPVLLIFEDAHWIDPTTLELLELVIDRVQTMPVLLIVTARPEFITRWSEARRVTTLTLHRLNHDEGVDLVGRVAGDRVLPDTVVEMIVAKSDGVPLFIEELTKAVVEAKLIQNDGEQFANNELLLSSIIPESLQDSLMARLDHLAPIKAIVQIGAAIGREFPHEIIAALADVSDEELECALDRLIEVELIFRRATPPDTTYCFKHALVQEAAYGTILRTRRRQLHARIAELIEQRFPQKTETEPELLAHHWEQAGLIEKAIDYRSKAGQQAFDHSAMVESIMQAKQGLNLIQELPDPARLRHCEVDLQIMLARALLATKGHASPETGKAYARAHKLCERVGSTAKMFPILWGQLVNHLDRGEPLIAHSVAQELMQVAQQHDDVSARVTAHRALGAVSFYLGHFVAARTNLQQALDLYDPEQNRTSGLSYGWDSRVLCSFYLSWTLIPLGYPDQALTQSRNGLAAARQISHASTLAFAMAHTCNLDRFFHDRQGVGKRLRMLNELRSLATDQNFSFWIALETICRGCAMAENGQIEAGIDQMRQGLAAYQATGAELEMPYYLALMAEACACVGQVPEGLRLLSEALERVSRTGERWFESELHRLTGTLLLSQANHENTDAEAHLLHAVDVARVQGAKLWELRAVTNLSSLWVTQGRHVEAHERLADVFSWFTEGFDIPDLKRARAILDQLA